MEELVMKKSVMLVLCILTGMLFVASMASAAYVGNGHTGIVGTAHDLSLGATGGLLGDNTEQGGKDRVCVYCHAPHNTYKLDQVDGIDYIPLWNHKVTTQSYFLYDNGGNPAGSLQHKSDAMIQTGSVGKPGGVSRLCLSCHDGSVGTNEYGANGASSHGDATIKTVAAAGFEAFLIGGNGNLTNHHPIGMDYATVVGTDNEINPASTTMFGTMTIGDLLWNGKMECTTCHDVHNTKNDPNADKFLWKSDQNSDFCLVCHLKNAGSN
jgi:predicted CXXCH cytochrome family protein